MVRSGQKPEWIKVPEGFILGCVEDATFKTERLVLNPGDRMLLYTDGVTEAMNREQAFYSKERLMSALERGKNASVEALRRRSFDL